MEEERRQEEEGRLRKTEKLQEKKADLSREREKAWLERWTILVVTYSYLFGL